MDETPNPIVFKEPGDHDWTVLTFHPYTKEHRPTWREAFELAYTFSRVRHVVTDSLIQPVQECS